MKAINQAFSQDTCSVKTSSSCEVSKCFSRKLVEEQGMLFQYAFSLTRDAVDAADLVQETALRALDNHHKFVKNVSFRGWLTTIMRNIYINGYQSKIRYWSHVDKNVDPVEVPTPAEGSYFVPDDAFNLLEINGAIDRLGDTARIPFRMYLDGYKYTEIAEVLEVPVGTIKSRIFSARRELQKRLSEMK